MWRLISQRLDMLACGQFEILLQEAELCDKNLPKTSSKMSDAQAVKVFLRLMREKKIETLHDFRQRDKKMPLNDVVEDLLSKCELQRSLCSIA